MTPEEVISLVQKYLSDANAENATGTHRGLVLVWASIIDDLIMKILLKHLVQLNSASRNDLFGPMGPLGGFSSRTKLAKALGLIQNDEASIIDEIRAIRNKFAHSLGVTLDDEELALKCRHIGNSMTGATGSGDPKLHFSSGCGSLLMLLVNRLGRVTPAIGLPDPRVLHERPYGVPGTESGQNL